MCRMPGSSHAARKVFLWPVPLSVITLSMRSHRLAQYATAARQNCTQLTAFSSDSTCANDTREWSSMARCTMSQPVPRLWFFVRSPVMRCPTPSMRPSVLISMCSNSPAAALS